MQTLILLAYSENGGAGVLWKQQLKEQLRLLNKVDLN